jgi:tetratricopeptide (TPR) repeat protein
MFGSQTRANLISKIDWVQPRPFGARGFPLSMLTEFEEGSVATRRLILRDALSILSLVLGTMVLFAITLFLFRSFSAHRADLAQRWSQRGRIALQQGKPDEAIVALRTALSYAPGTRDYELLLAEALGEAGHTDESYQYFMGLWDAEPGNGPVNLQLARLAARRRDRAAAVNFYRASIFGTWEGDGVVRRAEVRLELARYLIANGDLPAARLALLITGGNAPDDYGRDMALGDLLQQAQDATNAWAYYQRAAALRPDDPAAHAAAGRLAYQSGDYESAERMLARARAELAATHTATTKDFDDSTMLENAARMLELMPLPAQPARDRVAHVLAARAVARKRFDVCSAKFAAELPLPAPLQALDTRWIGPDGNASAAVLLRDPEQQDSEMQLVFDTEVQAQKVCDAATGDDALLLRLATTPHAISLPAAAGRAEQVNVPRD